MSGGPLVQDHVRKLTQNEVVSLTNHFKILTLASCIAVNLRNNANFKERKGEKNKK